MDLQLVDKNGNPLLVTEKGTLAVHKRLPDLAQLVFEGKVWGVQDQTTTAAATAPPTTTAGLTVQNPAGSGLYYVVFALSFIVDVMPASAESVQLWHCAHKLAVAALTRDITLQATGAGSICGLKAGQGAYNGVVILDRGATVVDDGWTPIADPISEAASNVDWGGYKVLAVPVVIPPSFHYSVHSLVTEATIEVGHGLVWAEVAVEELEEIE